MIFISRHLLFVLTTAAFLTACTAHAGDAPTADTLLALDKQANEAYIKGDGKFFESFLSDAFVMRMGGARLGKRDAVSMISGVECEVKAGWALTEAQMAKIDNNTYVLSYQSNMEGSCTAHGQTEELPSPVRAATVWTRNGDRWQAAFHGENLIFDPQAAPASGKKEAPKQDDRAAVHPDTAAAPAPVKSAAGPITDALMAAERSVWEAWKNKDANKIAALTADEITFINIFGTYFANKADVVRDWTGATCDVTGFTLTDGVGTAVSPAVGLLTLTGTVNGTCGGVDISGQKIYVTSVYVKDGEAWKWVFGFNSPS